MAKDLTKEVLPIEESKQEQKKQLYKNWKLYATTLGVVTIGLSVGLGVGLGTTGHHQNVVVTKKNLSDLGLKTIIDLSPDTTISDVNQLIDQFLQDNQDAASDLRNGKDIKINSYVLPDWGSSGWVEISGTGKYQGTLRINFPAWQQVDLSTLNATTITGSEDMQETDAFNLFLANNKENNLTDLKDNVNLLFTAPDYKNLGSLVIMAKPNTKYSETIKIAISILEKKDINQLNLNTDNINGLENMSKETAFAAFMANNQDQDANDLRANVNLMFTAPDYKNFGSLIITPTEYGKYSGDEIVVSINPISDQKDLSSLDLVLNFPSSFLTKETAFAAFLKLNQDKYPDLSDNVTIGSFNIGYMQDSVLEIKGIADDSKYIGTVKFIFNGLGSIAQVALDTIIDSNFTIDSTENMTSEMALQAFLDSTKKEHPDFNNNIEITNFTAPTYDNSGFLTITARTDIDNKYTGSITVTINKMSQQPLSELNLIDNIEFDEQWRTEKDIFDQFIKLNENLYPDLSDNITMGAFDRDNGTLEIQAKPGTKYSGSVNITFTANIKTNLNELGLQTSLVNSEVNTFYVDQTMAFEAFLAANSSINDLRDNVEIINFVNSEYNGKHGSLTLAAKADSKYAGEITIDLDAVTTPLNLDSFNGWNVGELEVADTDSAITDAIMNKIDQLIKPTLSDGGGITFIKWALSISVDASHTSITLTPGWLSVGKIIGSGTIYFTVKAAS